MTQKMIEALAEHLYALMDLRQTLLSSADLSTTLVASILDVEIKRLGDVFQDEVDTKAKPALVVVGS